MYLAGEPGDAERGFPMFVMSNATLGIARGNLIKTADAVRVAWRRRDMRREGGCRMPLADLLVRSPLPSQIRHVSPAETFNALAFSVS